MGGGTAGGGCDVINNGRHLGRHLGFCQELEIRLKPRHLGFCQELEIKLKPQEMAIFLCLR